jgi:hypothetical protein
MSHDDDIQSAPSPSSRSLEDVAAGSESTKKRKFIEELQNQENPPPKRQRSGKSKSSAPQATTSLLPPPEFSEFVGFVYEQGYPPKPRRARKHPVVAQAQGDSKGNAYGPPQMHSGQVRECDTSAPPSISNAPTTSVNAHGMGRGQTSKPDLKRKRKAEDGDPYSADAPQPRTVVPTGPGPLPSVRSLLLDFFLSDSMALI